MEFHAKLAAGSKGEYALKIATLFSLRCLCHQNDGEFWIAFNVDGFGPFGDILLHHAGTTYMLHLNYDDDPGNAKKWKCSTPTGDLYFLKLFSGLGELNSSMGCNIIKYEFLKHVSEHGDFCVIFYTNEEVDECGVLENVYDSNLFFLHPNAKLSKVIYTKLSEDFNLAKNLNLRDAYLCVDKKSIEDINTEIVKEIRKIADCLKTDFESIAEEFTTFIKTCLAENHYLAKEAIACKFTELLFRNYEVDLSDRLLEYQNEEKLKLWNEIIQDQIITIVESDEVILKFLVEYINYEIGKYFKNVNTRTWRQNLAKEQVEMFYQEHENLVSTILGRSKNTTILDIYKILWTNKKLPVLLIANDILDCVNILNILSVSKDSFKIILINRNPRNVIQWNSIKSEIKPLESLENLDENKRRIILNLPIKLQGRSEVLLKDALDETMFKFVNCNDLIEIISENFNIGDKHAYCKNFIDRSVSKVFMKLQALDEILDETFLVEDVENIFGTLITKNLNVRNIKDVEVLQPGIIISHDRITLEQLQKPKTSKVIHYLTIYDRRYLEWKNSFGSIQKIRKFQVELKDIGSKAISDWTKSVTIINGAPGIGKSTLMDVVAQQAPGNKLILRINLTDHQHYYKTIRNVETNASQHLNFFSNSCLTQHKCKTKLNQAVFQKYTTAKDVIVLLDGFDEVSVCYKEEISSIAKSLHQEGYQMWITTRPVTKLYLEELFDTFSVTLKPFTFENQKQFLIKYYNVLDLGSKDLVIHFVEKLLNLAKKNLNDQYEEIVGSPLYVKLLAEAFRDDCRNFLNTDGQEGVNENFDLLYLYQNFVDSKISNLYEKFGAVEHHERGKLKEHQALLALKLLFPLHDHIDIEKELDHYRNEPTKIQLLQREGVITVDERLTVNFTHRTFAEFIAAQWLAENVHSRKAQILMKERFSPDYKFLFNIFDRFLAKDLPLHLAVINKRFEDAKRIINSDPSSVTLLDESGKSVMHVAALYSVQFPLLFHECAHFFADSEAIDFINLRIFERDATPDIIERIPDYNISDIKKDILGYNPLDYALANNSLAAAHKIYSKLKPSTINASINLNYKKSYLGFCALLDYKSLFDLLLFHFVSRDLLLKNVDENAKVTTYLQSIYSRNMYTHEILDYEIDYGTMTILNLLQSKSAHSGYINGHYSDLRYAIIFDSKDDVEKLLKATLEINAQDHDNNTPLHYTALYGRLEITQLLLFRGAKLDTLNNSEDTALNIALRENHVEIANMLIANGANADLGNRKGQTPLHYAIQNDYYEIVKKILSKGELTDKQDTRGNTPLHLAWEKGQVDIAKSLISKGFNGNRKNRRGETPLHYAIQNSHSDIAHEIIVKFGINNTQNIDNNTPLHLALMKNLIDIAELLISNGADVNIENGQGKTPLHMASETGSKDITEKILISFYGAAINSENGNASVFNNYSFGSNFINGQDFQGNTPLHIASEKGNLDTVRLLLSNGADIDIRNKKHDTPLHLLIKSKISYEDLKDILSDRAINSSTSPLHLTLMENQLDKAELLILKGACVNEINTDGENALQYAIQRGYSDIINLILTTKEIFLDQENFKGDTALHLALMRKDFDISEKLLSKGANFNIKNYRGDTALSYALDNGHDDIAKTMISKSNVDLSWTKNSNTLLHVALMKGQVEAAEMLILSGADVNIVNDNRETAFLLAVRNGCYKIAEKLIDKSNVNVRQRKDGNTPLHWALARDDINTIKLLLANGADVNIGNKNGKTALYCAAKKGDIAMMLEILSAKNSNVNKQNTKGDTPLHIACLKGFTEIAKLLLLNGIDVFIRNSKGKTANNLASECGCSDILSLLENYVNDHTK